MCSWNLIPKLIDGAIVSNCADNCCYFYFWWNIREFTWVPNTSSRHHFDTFSNTWRIKADQSIIPDSEPSFSRLNKEVPDLLNHNISSKLWNDFWLNVTLKAWVPRRYLSLCRMYTGVWTADEFGASCLSFSLQMLFVSSPSGMREGDPIFLSVLVHWALLRHSLASLHLLLSAWDLYLLSFWL